MMRLYLLVVGAILVPGALSYGVEAFVAPSS
jgi:hypothetical protein